MRTKKPISKAPATKKPGARKPVAKKPVAKKPAAKKPAARVSKSADAEPQTSDPPPAAADQAYTLPGLLGRLTKPVSESDVKARVVVLDDQLIELGRRIGTERISVDCARIFGIALDFFTQATPTQRRALLGLSLRTLEVAIWAAHHDAALWQRREQDLRTQASLQKLRGVDAQAVLGQAEGRREQLYEALLGIAGGQPKQVAEVRSDYGQRSTAALLGQSLRALARRGRAYLTTTDADTRVRLLDTAVDEALLTDTEALAARVEQVGPAAKAPRGKASVSQDQVDLWDGYALTFFERIVRVFTAGRAVDPTIPRLVPIALYRWYFGYESAKKDPPPADPRPA